MKNFLLGVMATVLCIVLLGANFNAAAPTMYEYQKEFCTGAARLPRVTGLLAVPAGWRITKIWHHGEYDEPVLSRVNEVIFEYLIEKEITDAPIKSYEYKVSRWWGVRNSKIIGIATLNKLGKEGWRVIEVMPFRILNSRATYYFLEREKR